MQSTELILVSITAPEAMEESIAAEMLDLGASGYTAWTVRGRGVHGARPSTWTGANVRVETAVSQEVAERIVARMLEKYPLAVPLMIMTRTITIHQRGLFFGASGVFLLPPAHREERLSSVQRRERGSVVMVRIKVRVRAAVPLWCLAVTSLLQRSSPPHRL